MANWNLEDIKSNCNIDSNSCWNWKDSLGCGGYGRVTVHGVRHLLHRYTFTLTTGIKLEPKDIMCHKCNNRACCNPEHIYIGSRTENTLDAIKAGTHVSGYAVHQASKTRCISVSYTHLRAHETGR